MLALQKPLGARLAERDAPAGLLGMPEIVLHLHLQPEVRRRAERGG